MTDSLSLRTFSAANSADGFVSFFDDITDTSDVTVIKGGPGTGKSTLMKEAADTARREGIETERIFCSSDCDSLDGVYLPGLERFLCDGTAPHTVEPRYPGVKDTLLDVGRFRDDDLLKRDRAAVLDLYQAVSEAYSHAYAFLKSAGQALLTVRALAAPYRNDEKLFRYTDGLIRRHIPEQKDAPKGRLRRRFLSAYAHKGFVTFKDTIYGAAEHVYVLSDVYGLAPAVMSRLCGAAIDRGYGTYVFFDPLLPADIAHLLIPSLGLAFVTSSKRVKFEPQNGSLVNLSAFVHDDVFLVRNKIAFTRRVFTLSVEAALDHIAHAKALHDDLEEYYIAAMDFDALRKTAQETARRFCAKG